MDCESDTIKLIYWLLSNKNIEDARDARRIIVRMMQLVKCASSNDDEAQIHINLLYS